MQDKATLKFNGQTFNGTIIGAIMDALLCDKMSEVSVKRNSNNTGFIVKHDGVTYECDRADSDEYLFFMCESLGFSDDCKTCKHNTKEGETKKLTCLGCFRSYGDNYEAKDMRTEES